MQIFDLARVFSQKNNGTVCPTVPMPQRGFLTQLARS
jgi:hypothetical protein